MQGFQDTGSLVLSFKKKIFSYDNIDNTLDMFAKFGTVPLSVKGYFLMYI